MDYQRIYEKLIDRARKRKLNEYHEKHHVIPRCMGGLDTSSNLVKLTPEEHYLAHQLLVKIHPRNDKLIYAAVMMASMRGISNKLYGWLKRRASAARSKAGGYHTQNWVDAMASRKGYRHTVEARSKMSQRQSLQRKPLSEKHRDNLRKAAIRRKKEGRYGSLSKEGRKNLSAAMKVAAKRGWKTRKLHTLQ